ncbi:MAG: transcriptional regulator [Dehalococcoidales bacterium]|nr:transcriptional regulator [Dehalococcoidales bacterium]
MTFAEKLDLLMNITRTSNSMLARSIALDASFISRLRRGVRTPVENAGYLPLIARYFSRNCTSDYQKAALAEAMKNPLILNADWSTDTEKLLLKWLQENAPIQPGSINNFLEEMGRFQFKKPAPAEGEMMTLADNTKLGDIEIFYGIEGKRTAVLHFLSLILQKEDIQTLLLYSNEELSWLADDPDFLARWAALMFRILGKGHRVKIIHTVNRNFNEMMAGIMNWMPLYMTGSIEPYYCPRTRDDIFRRTLFIAPGTAAITSSSVKSDIAGTANLLFTRPEAIKALRTEFRDYLELCRPLMQIFNPFRPGDYLETLAEFEGEKGDTIIRTSVLSGITMPDQLSRQLMGRLPESVASVLLIYQNEKSSRFFALLEKHHFTEIISLPELETILQGQVMVDFSDIPGGTPVYYTPDEYRQHLKYMIKLLNNCKNYHVCLVEDKVPASSMIYVKEGVGVLVGKTTLPSVIFALNESNVTAAFWDYANIHLLKGIHSQDRQQTISRLENIAASF